MKQINFTYAVIDAENLSNYSDVGDVSTLRYNNTGKKCIIKFYKENTTVRNIPLYSKEKIMKILERPEWRTYI